MEVQKTKKRVVASSAMIISIAVHVVLILLVGGMVALKLYKKEAAGFVVEEQKPKLERRKLQMPVKTQPFMEQMSKPKRQSTSRITANTPQMVNIPEQGEYVKMAPVPTFRNAYTNFVEIDRTLEFNSKYRTVDFGLSAVNFFGVKGKAEKVVIVADTSTSMLYDSRGGPDSYAMVRKDLTNVVENMRSATLFNLVLFDRENVSLFNPSMIPATPQAKTNVLEWIGGINTNLARVGLKSEMVNYTPQPTYALPMAQEDIAGWLKGVQAALEMKPEVIFMLGADWGTISMVSSDVSYFKKQAAYDEYQKKRAAAFLKDEEAREEMEEFMVEFDQYRAIALKMIELENQAREAMALQPKVLSDWDEILVDNDVELPLPPLMESDVYTGMSPAETRYTTSEIFESLFIMALQHYRHLGFPKLNVVMLKANNAASSSSTEASSLMTSDAKFRSLAKMVKGRFRYLNGMPRINNELDQQEDEILELLESERTNGL